MTAKETEDALSAALDALGDVMLEMQRRRLLVKAVDSGHASMADLMSRQGKTDDELGEMAANAFEAGATHLAKLGRPGCQVFVCKAPEGELE